MQGSDLHDLDNQVRRCLILTWSVFNLAVGQEIRTINLKSGDWPVLNGHMKWLLLFTISQSNIVITIDVAWSPRFKRAVWDCTTARQYMRVDNWFLMFLYKIIIIHPLTKRNVGSKWLAPRCSQKALGDSDLCNYFSAPKKASWRHLLNFLPKSV